MGGDIWVAPIVGCAGDVPEHKGSLRPSYRIQSAAAAPVMTVAADIRSTAIVYRFRSLISIHFLSGVSVKDKAHTAELFLLGRGIRKVALRPCVQFLRHDFVFQYL